MLIKVLIDGKLTHAYFTKKTFLTLQDITESMQGDTVILSSGQRIEIIITGEQYNELEDIKI